jgi:hypothetical protein
MATWGKLKNPSGFGFASVAAINGYRETPISSLNAVQVARVPIGIGLDRERRNSQSKEPLKI